MSQNDTKTSRFRKIARQIVPFRSDRRGSLAANFALTLLPIIGFAGAAIDYSRAVAAKSQLQAAIDRMALQAIDLPPEERLAQILAAMTPGSDGEPDVSIDGDRDTVSIVASRSVPTSVLKAVGIESIPVAARSGAAIVENGPPVCVLALNETASGAVTFSGSSVYVGRDCVVHSNSRHSQALVIQGSARPQAAGFCSVGGASAPADLSPQPREKCRPARDPFAGLQRPSSAGCDHNNLSINPQQNRRLSPGVYCGGLTVRGTARLEPGIYVIKDGSLSVNSQAAITGAGVTIFVTGLNGGFTINGGGNVSLSAPTEGAFGGVLIFHDPASNPGTENRINGDSGTILQGGVYTPAHAIRLNGSSGFGQETAYMPVVADRVTITGNTDMRLDLTGVELTAPLPLSTTFARLVE